MNTPTVSDEEQAAAFLAWKRGEPCEFLNILDQWMPLDENTWLKKSNSIRRKPAPKLRPWKPEKVPLESWFRNIQSEGLFRLVSVRKTYVLMGFNAKEGSEHTYESLLRNMEHSIDGGKTWKPCGVIEETP